MHESRTAPFRGVESAFQTWLAANAPRNLGNAPLALVQISDEELASHPWPWTPVDTSLFLNAALTFGPRVVAVEPVLAWNEPDASQVALLHNQLLRAPKALLGAEFGFPEDPALLPPLQEVPVLRHVVGNASRVPDFPVIAAQPADDLRMAATLGFFEPAVVTVSGSCEPVRRVPLVFRYRGLVTPSFVLQAAMLWYGVTPEEVEVVPGSHIALGKALRIPVDAAGTMAVDFAIPLIRFSAADLILSAEQFQSGHATTAPVGTLKDGLALLARTDKEARTLPLANGRLGSRGELAAAAIATLQTGKFPVRAGLGAEAAIVAAAGLLGWFCNRRGKLAAAILCLGVFCFYLLGALGVFAAGQVALPLLLPAGLMLFLVLYRQLE
jgi:hypothetical protein